MPKSQSTSNNVLSYFCNYWDNVIKDWLSSPGVNAIDARRYKDLITVSGIVKECYYKDYNYLSVNIEKEQKIIFNSKGLGNKLYPAHMPEPYHGDPTQCSIVIVNYNPAGGTDMNPHTYRGNNQLFPSNTIIDYVAKNSYSAFAKSFPIWQDTLPKGMEWLCSYAGRRWWLEKKDWVNHLVNAKLQMTQNGAQVEDNADKNRNKPKPPFPFVIELCGWHSPNWGDVSGAISKNQQPQNVIKTHFVDPLLAAIESSTSKLAVCIGAQFKPALFTALCNNNFTDITRNIWKKLNSACKTYSEYPSKKIKDSIGVTQQNRTRYYRVYDVQTGNVHHYILNTFAPGGNHHPANHFWKFEEELLKVI